MERGEQWAVLALLLAALLGCGPRPRPPVYEDEQGFHFTPPPGWSERARPAASSAATATRRGGAELPAPPLGPGERLLVRYDLPRAGRSAWIWVTTAQRPATTSLEALVAERAPRSDWRREGGVENLTVGGRPAARLAFAGRWGGQDYLCETVAVRREGQVYFITASFPAGEAAAREQVRRAVGEASWR
jgi:hypothetical protein